MPSSRPRIAPAQVGVSAPPALAGVCDDVAVVGTRTESDAVGTGDEPADSYQPSGSDFAPLMREVRDSGLLERRRGYYARAMALNVALFIGLGVGVVLIGDSWWQLLLALPAAVLSARCGFFGHDAGHQQIAHTKGTNRLVGLIHGNLLTGMSFGWWVDKHNRHHANPNHVEKDPDVGAGALVWTQVQAGERQGAARWLTRNQAYLFFPMLLLEGFALRVASVMTLSSRPRGQREAELALIVVHTAAYVALPLVFMSPVKTLVFILIHQAAFGLHLGCAFAPNHKGMPMPTSEDRWGHLQRQVSTSRNVRGGPVVDWMLGGLNYQIEHHLFPSVPRPNLRRIQPLVRAHCADVGLDYTETGLWESYATALRHLYDVAAPLRAAN